jgi:phosphoribosylanthranilate isomerase
LLTSEQSATAIVSHINRVHTNTVQIVDELTDGAYTQIREALPHIRIVQVIHVTGRESIDQALQVQQYVDAILLDSGNPKLAIKTLGGTGNTHDWLISRDLVEAVNIPVFLAGGLNAVNVAKAIATVRPFAVDVCSGVRTGGRLDPEKLDAFISAIRK